MLDRLKCTVCFGLVDVVHITSPHIYIYIYGTPPKKNLCSHHFCWYLQYFVSILGCLLILVFFWGGYHIYIYICARRLHDLFVHFGRNAVRMRSMHSECIPAQYQDQDP